MSLVSRQCKIILVLSLFWKETMEKLSNLPSDPRGESLSEDETLDDRATGLPWLIHFLFLFMGSLSFYAWLIIFCLGEKVPASELPHDGLSDEDPLRDIKDVAFAQAYLEKVCCFNAWAALKDSMTVMSVFCLFAYSWMWGACFASHRCARLCRRCRGGWRISWACCTSLRETQRAGHQ